jgi:pyochelin biosynthetic protein PchC
VIGLPADVELASVQYPGRLDRIAEACIDDMDRLADLVTEALTSLPDRPIALFGHSLGATIAYEVARRIETRPGEGVARLFVSGRPPPHRQRATAKHLSHDDLLWQELSRLGGTESYLLGHREVRSIFIPTLRSDYRLAETYLPREGPPLRAPITAFLADRDPEVGVEEARAWGELTLGGFELRVFPGDHFYVIPCRDELIREILRRLDPCFVDGSGHGEGAVHCPPKHGTGGTQ